MGKLCQQRLLLAGLALLCFLLPLVMGPAAESALAQGVSFSGITLAITAPEDDPVPRQLEQILSGMQDISRYCQIKAMDPPTAREALARGEVTAVLALPDRFVQGIMSGTNPDVELIVSGDRPLEALLTFWVGRSASELLAAVQNGIYAVLELYGDHPTEGLSFQDAMMRINLRYISWTVNRQGIYRIQQIPVTDQLPLGLHYSLSLFAWLVLCLAPMFAGIYERTWITSQKRFRALGIGSGTFYTASLAACWILDALLIMSFLLVMPDRRVGQAILSGILCGLFCSIFGSFCCLVTSDTGSCGALSFVSALVFLALSGGIVPQVLMPAGLQGLIRFSPVTWLRQIMAVPLEYEAPLFPAAALALSAFALGILGGLLYRHRGSREVAV